MTMSLFCFSQCSREIMDIFPCQKQQPTKQTLTLPFSDTLTVRSFKLCMIITLLGGLHFHCTFDDIDFVSRSQVCQKYKLQNVLFGLLFRLSAVV